MFIKFFSFPYFSCKSLFLFSFLKQLLIREFQQHVASSAVAAPAVLLDKVVIEKLQITTGVVKRVTGQPLFATGSRACVLVLCAHTVA